MARGQRRRPNGTTNTATSAAGAPAPSAGGTSRRRKVEPIQGYSFFPSDLTWLYAECPYCFYTKVKCGVKRPGGMMPAIFRVIDTRIREFCLDKKRTEAVCPEMPPGEFVAGETWVRSRSFAPFPGGKERFTLRGKPDAIIRWDDGTHGVADYKTTAVKESSGSFYATQLETYSNALEQPYVPRDPESLDARDAHEPMVISQNGLLAWEPLAFGEGVPGLEGAANPLDLRGRFVWIPVPRNQEGLRTMLREATALLDADEPPPPSHSCSFCSYRDAYRRLAEQTQAANASSASVEISTPAAVPLEA